MMVDQGPSKYSVAAHHEAETLLTMRTQRTQNMNTTSKSGSAVRDQTRRTMSMKSNATMTSRRIAMTVSIIWKLILAMPPGGDYMPPQMQEQYRAAPPPHRLVT